MTVSCRSWLAGAWVAAALVSCAATASAQNSETWTKCVNKTDSYSKDVQIHA